MDSAVIILLAGWLLDLIFGDPERLPHPVVYMGKWISFGEKRLNQGTRRKMKGALFTLFSISALFSLTYLISHPSSFLLSPSSSYPSSFPLSPSSLLFILITFFCLAGHTLRKEVRMVFEAVDRSVEDGRKQVARIVGRDTSELTAQECRTAALETLAENLSDGVIAPLFWFAVLGVPGMITYKLINTFDSMIGYQNERYKDFGCWAAHIDDIANYIPARITALLMLLVSPLAGKCDIIHYLRFVLRFGNKHASPNSGWPEAALAGILDCRFGGPHNYFGEYFYKPYIGSNPRLLTTADMNLSIRICLMAEILAVALVCFLLTYNSGLI